jgi:hypothetical protein
VAVLFLDDHHLVVTPVPTAIVAKLGARRRMLSIYKNNFRGGAACPQFQGAIF